MSRSFATLMISPEAYGEIKTTLLAADYGHAIGESNGIEVIDMHGIALQLRKNKRRSPK